MNRTLATIGIFGALMAGVYLLKDKWHFAPNIGTPTETQQKVVTSTPVKKNFKTKGAKHEDRTKRHGSTKIQRPRSGEDERASDELDEIESLASIYQDQEAKPERSAVAEEELNSQAEGQSPIPGVKVSAWVSSQKHAVPKDVPDPSVGTGMRYFLNCVELKKKGVSPLEAKDCDALIAVRRTQN